MIWLPRSLTFFALATVSIMMGVRASVVSDADSGTPRSTRLVTADEIRTAEVEQRTRIVGCVAAVLADDAKMVARIRRDASFRDDLERSRFDAHAQKVEAHAKSVRKAMKAAERASYESWEEVRTELANEFVTYTQLADRLQVFANEQRGPIAVANATTAKSPTPRKTSLQAP